MERITNVSTITMSMSIGAKWPINDMLLHVATKLTGMHIDSEYISSSSHIVSWSNYRSTHFVRWPLARSAVTYRPPDGCINETIIMMNIKLPRQQQKFLSDLCMSKCDVQMISLSLFSTVRVPVHTGHVRMEIIYSLECWKFPFFRYVHQF